jgi:bifunctional non-homologous end joining protein LigD
VDFAEVKKAAIEVRDLLKQVKLASFLKTTGGKGLHIVVPFQKGPTWDQVKNFTRTFAEEMVKREPDRFTANSRKNARAGKIYIDYLRNGEGASSVAPYSTRAREGAPVAAPLNWNELAALKSGHSFTIQNIATRLKKDPWKDMAKTKQRLPL